MVTDPITEKEIDQKIEYPAEVPVEWREPENRKSKVTLRDEIEMVIQLIYFILLKKF